MELYYIVILTVFINIIWWVLYIIDTLKWKTKPNRVSWWIWAAAPLIWTAATLYSQWFVWSVLPVFVAGFIPLLIFISSFINKNSYWKLTKIDYLCLVFAVLALVLWLITNNPLLAIVFAVLADWLAAIPTLIKMYYLPDTESISPYLSGFLAASTSLLVIENWVLEEYLFPSYLVLWWLSFMLVFYRKKIFKLNLFWKKKTINKY